MERDDRRPHDATAQLLEYATTGRLLEGADPRRGSVRATIVTVVSAALALGGSVSLVTLCTVTGGDPTMTVAAGAVALGSLTILVPAIRLLRIGAEPPPVRVRPAAVLSPELVRAGNWIHRHGAWLRVEHVGRDGGGRIHALLSSGDVAELTTPTTIAGDHFRPTHDPVASLRD